MASVIWETDDSFDSMYIVWSGVATVLGSTLYADYDYVYMCSVDIYRVLRGPGSGSSNFDREETQISPVVGGGPFIMTHHLNEWGDYFYSVALKAPFIPAVQPEIYHSYWPEEAGSWQSYTWSGSPVDVVFPNYLDDLRVLVGVSNSGGGYVIVQSVSESGILTRHNTDWSLMTSNTTVTDLETREII